VTRDAVRAVFELGDRKFRLVDTGGYRVEARDMDSLVKEKSLAEMSDASAVLMVCDVQDFNAEDESFLEYLRPMSNRVVLVVNKVDNPAREQQVWNYYSLGFERVVGISSAHGLGISDLEDTLAQMMDSASGGGEAAGEGTAAAEGTTATEGTAAAEGAVAGAEAEQREPIRIALLGKPNTGKSTLANRLAGRETSIVSEEPGTTRDVIEGSFSYRGSLFCFADTAGIRRKTRIRNEVEYYSVNRAIGTVEESDLVMLLIDAEEGLTEQDKKIAVQAVKRGKGILLVLNKWDLIKDIPNQTQAVKDRIRFLFPILGFAPLVAVSARTGEGLPKLLNTAYGVWKQLNKRVETSRLNDMLQQWYQAYEPPRGRHGHYKIFYGTQISANPVRFVLFVNRKEGFPDAYIQYITNNIRRHLGFPYVPLRIELRERPKRER
jgi:GTP-binding protein